MSTQHRFRTITNKGTTTQRGYGYAHQQERKRWLARKAELVCTRCRHPLAYVPDYLLHLDHNSDRTGYLGLAHATCNKRAGARAGNRKQRGKTSTDALPRRY